MWQPGPGAACCAGANRRCSARSTVGVDAFTARLFKIHQQVLEEGTAQVGNRSASVAALLGFTLLETPPSLLLGPNNRVQPSQFL